MNTETQVQAVRGITIYSTKGAKKAKLQTDVKTWGELSILIHNEGYDLSSLHATENVNKSDLVNTQAVLPSSDFTVFMRPKKTKSGAERGVGLSYKEIKSTIKADMEAHGDVAKEHYNSDGENYTRKGTEVLRSLINSFVAPESKGEKAPKAEKVVEEVVETVQEEVAEVVKVMTNSEHLDAVEYHLAQICENSSSEAVCERVTEITEDLIPGLRVEIDGDTEALTTNVADVVSSVAESKETAEEEGRRIAREKAEKEETERIEAAKAAEAEAKRLEKEEDERLAEEAKLFS